MDSYRPSRRSFGEENDSRAPRGRRHRGHDFQSRGGRPGSPGRRRFDAQRRFDGGDRGRDREWDDRRQGAWGASQRGYNANAAGEPHSAPAGPPDSTGENDVSSDGEAVQFLLVRGLRTNVDEAHLARGLSKLCREAAPDSTAQATAPESSPAAAATTATTTTTTTAAAAAGAAPGSMKRVFVVRERLTERSAGFGFVEFFSVADAKAALSKAKQLGPRCTISSREIEVAFPHMGVFTNFGVQNTHPRYTFELREGSVYEYHDGRYFAKEHIVNTAPPAPPPRAASPPAEPAPAKAGQKRGISNTIGSAAEPKAKKTKAGNTAPTAPVNEQLHLWTLKQSELRGNCSGHEEETQKEMSDTLTKPTAPPSSSAGANHGVGSLVNHRQSFVYKGVLNGTQQTCCLLCQTSMGDTIDPKRHCTESARHLANLKDKKMVDDAWGRMERHGIECDQTLNFNPVDKTAIATPADKTAATSPAEGESKAEEPTIRPQQARTVYIDRAQERREKEAKERREEEARSGPPERFKMSLKRAEYQQSKPADPSSTIGSSSPSATTSSDATPASEAATTYGKGFSLLQKAGYTPGQSLGSGSGSGITAPIEVNLYAEGVGLGHQSSNQGNLMEEMDRKTKSDAKTFLEKTKESSFGRYEQVKSKK